MYCRDPVAIDELTNHSTKYSSLQEDTISRNDSYACDVACPGSDYDNCSNDESLKEDRPNETKDLCKRKNGPSAGTACFDRAGDYASSARTAPAPSGDRTQ